VARRLRIEYAGALHHVINRGNYRRDLFADEKVAEAFVRTLFEAAGKFGWRVQAYVLMSNHFHLAVATPEPTLGEGMHWLQSTMATWFNRLRGENGHLFQGRYKSLLIEDATALARVVDYIHLNPVRAKVVPPERLAEFRWSSLPAFLTQPRLPELEAQDWLQARGGWSDDEVGWRAYMDYLSGIARDEAGWEQAGLVGMSHGWAIGTAAWRQALAKEHAQKALSTGLPRDERLELRQASWRTSLAANLTQAGKMQADLETRPLKQKWKVALAVKIRGECGAPIAWLAEQLKLGRSGSLRGYLHRTKRAQN